MSDKSMLMSAAADTFAELERAIEGLSDEAMGQVWLGTWGVREILVHISGWHREMIPAFARVARGEATPYPAGTYDDFDAWNARFVAAKAGVKAADVLTEILPILDNFERALQAPAPPEADSFRKGIELIHKQMLEMLRKRGVKPIEAVGADFDPNFHQAVIHEASSGHREGEVTQELQRGYMLGDRLLRPAMVKVAKSS